MENSRKTTPAGIASAALHDREEDFRSLVEQSPLSIQILSPDGRTLQVNRAFEVLWGVSGAALKDYNILTDQQLVRIGLMPYIRRAFAGEATSTPPVEYNSITTVGAGNKKWVQARIYPVKNDAGIIRQVVLIHEDITLRRAAEQALRTSEERHRLAETIGHVGNWEYDLQTGQLWGSEEAKRIYGFNLDQHEFTLEEVEACVPEKARVHQALRDLIETGKPYDLEFEIQPRSASEPRMVSSMAKLQRDDQGCPLRVMGVVQDITEHKQAEAALRESERRFRELMENIQLIGVMLDTRGKVIFCNDYLLRVTGWTRDEVLDHDWFSRFTPGNKALEQVFHRNIVAGTIPPHIENDIVMRQGKPRLISWDNTVLRNQQGVPIGVACIGEDITERRHAEETLRQSEQRKTILNQIAQIFLTASNQEMFAQVLDVVLRVMKSPFGLFGFIGANGDLFIPSLTGEVWNQCTVPGKSIVFPKSTWGKNLWARAIRERRTFCSDGPFHPPAGHVRIEHFLAVPIVSGEATIGLLAVANAPQGYIPDDVRLLEILAESMSPILNSRMQRNLQEQKRQQAEEEIHKLNAELETRVIQRTAQLEAANKELESFCYSVSHDLRAPLRAISGFASILTENCEKQLNEEDRRHLSIVRSEAERMGRLIDDLLAFSRMGRQAMQVANINMDELAQKVFDECVTQAPNRQIRFTLHPLPPARADETLLHEVWVNLISNAIKYTRHQPVAEIEILGRVEDIELVYGVKDNGVGFDMKYADRLFGVFQRLHSDSDFEGTGVGLSLVQRIVARHGGRVWAEAKTNEGASFYFTLPKSTKTDS